MKISYKLIGLILGPVLFLIISNMELEILSDQAMKVLALATWMIVWWITEASPVAVAALLPIIVLPAQKVFTVAEATAPYASPIIFLFMGGFFIALGLEEYGLHKRIALNLIKVIGTSANRIILGFMLATGFLSMWISNTASAIMMLPIAITVIDLLDNESINRKSYHLFALALMLGIAYSANIGGMGTIVGTPPTVVFVGYAEELLNIQVDFSQWLLIGLPISGLMLLLTYIILTHVMFRNNLGKIEASKELIQSELKALGPMTREEKMVTAIFTLTAFLWIFKMPINNLLGIAILNDTGTAILGGSLMFVLPVNLKKAKGLVPWKATNRLPWGILLLFGGGMSLAKAMETTGIIQVIADVVEQNPMGSLAVYVILIGSMLFLTELMSNVALATVYIPVVIGIAKGLGLDPLLLSIPVAMAASCAFMMPISTPPNAIVFASGHIQMKDMIKVGFILNILAVILLTLASFTIIDYVFGA